MCMYIYIYIYIERESLGFRVITTTELNITTSSTDTRQRGNVEWGEHLYEEFTRLARD